MIVYFWLYGTLIYLLGFIVAPEGIQSIRKRYGIPSILAGQLIVFLAFLWPILLLTKLFLVVKNITKKALKIEEKQTDLFDAKELEHTGKSGNVVNLFKRKNTRKKKEN